MDYVKGCTEVGLTDSICRREEREGRGGGKVQSTSSPLLDSDMHSVGYSLFRLCIYKIESGKIRRSSSNSETCTGSCQR